VKWSFKPWFEFLKFLIILYICLLVCVNPLHAMSRLGQLCVLLQKLPQLKRLVQCQSFSTAFLSIDGNGCYIPVFREKKRLSYYLCVWLFPGNLGKCCGILYAVAFTLSALQFLAVSFVARRGSQMVTDTFSAAYVTWYQMAWAWWLWVMDWEGHGRM
jgi:hypothetical protein